MSYEPSHRRSPPRQARWPHATPQEGWPAYLPGDGDRDGDRGRELQAADRHGWAADAFAGGYAGRPGADGGGRTSHPWNGNGHDRRGGARSGYGGTRNGYGGYVEAGSAFPGAAGFPDRLDRGEYAEPRPPGPLLIAPDTIGEPGWLRDQSKAPGRERDRSQPVIGAVTGFLAAAVAIGFATLAAAFVRPQASPVIAVGGAFIDRVPPTLKNFAVEHFGENDKTVLLLGMYATIALVAAAVGCLAQKRGVTIGVAGIAAFGLFGAFVAITRPESRPTDVIPSAIGGIAGVIALLWLDRRAAPLAPPRPAPGGSRRRRAG